MLDNRTKIFSYKNGKFRTLLRNGKYKAGADTGKKLTSSKFPGFPILSNISPIFHKVFPVFHKVSPIFH